jgi:hypothetical protein
MNHSRVFLFIHEERGKTVTPENVEAKPLYHFAVVGFNRFRSRTTVSAKCLVGSSSVTRNPPPVRWLSGKNSRLGSGVSKNSGSGNWFDLWDDSSNFYAPV